MANLPPGFLEALATKYAIADRDSQARTAQETAQTAQIAPNAQAQRAVQNAQAGQITAQTGTIAPLAESQIETGRANVGETNARGGYFNALGQSTLHDLISAPEDALRGFGRSVLGLSDSPGTGNVIGGSPTTTTQTSVLGSTPRAPVTSVGFQPTPDERQRQERGALGFSKGTTSVPAPPKGKGMPGYAQGTPSVPGPGQTVTTGSWEGPTPAPPATGNQLARAAGLGARVPRPQTYSKGATKVPGKGSSKVDTVPAMLAPKEAVLNEHAADLIGRDNITAANAAGNHIAGFAKGVTHVGRGLAAVLSSLGQSEGQAKKAPATKGMP
jgi:hypothetical protein